MRMVGYADRAGTGNLLPFERPFATLLTMIEVDTDDRRSPTRPSSSAPVR